MAFADARAIFGQRGGHTRIRPIKKEGIVYLARITGILYVITV